MARASQRRGIRFMGCAVSFCAAIMLGGCGRDSATTAVSQTGSSTVAADERTFAGPEEVHDVWGDGDLFAGAAEVAYYSSLPQMVADSDLIVDGVLTDVALGGTSGPADDQFSYYTVALETKSYVKGSGPGTLEVETFVGGGLLSKNRDALVGSRVLVFLASQGDDARSAGASEDEIAAYAGRYRFNNSQGVLVKSDAGTVQPYRQGDADLLGVELQPYDKVLTTVRTLVSTVNSD